MRRKEREISDSAEIEAIISKADVCRIAMADGNFPYLLAMNFGYSGGEKKKIFFHCAPEGRKLEMIRRNSYVCFEFDIDHKIIMGDRACDFGMNYKSVVGWGNITILEDKGEKAEGLNVIMEHYTGKSNFEFDEGILSRTVLLRLDITVMSGKRCG